jgi:hypothetical protein
VKTADNSSGLISFTTFNEDEDRIMIATLSAKSITSIQIKDYSLNQDYTIDNIFGDLQE